MPDPFELDKEVEDFFNSANSVHSTPDAGSDPATLAAEASAAAAVAATPASPAATVTPATTAAPAPTEDPAVMALRAQLGSLQAYQAQIERNVQQLAARAAPATQAPTAPDPETDPLGHMMHELAETKKMIAQLNERMAQQDQSSQQTNELRGFVENVQTMTTAFMAKQADYAQAYNYLRTVRTQDMKDLGVPANEIPNLLLKEELAVASRAINQGMNPAQLVYNIATRYGYKPVVTPVVPAVKMAALQQGVKAAPTPVDPSGTGVQLTLDSVKDMSSDQLDKLVDSNDLWAKVVGGKAEGNSIFH